MRTITVTEKYRAVNEGRMSKAEFVRQMRQAYPMYVSPVGTYDSTVQILKNKNMLFEEKEQEVDDTFKYSDDSLRRAIDIELEAMGLMSHGNVSMDDQVKAKKKAIANLKKDPLHYYHLISGDSSKVNKHDKEVEVKRGALEVDTFNGLKKAELKEAKLMTEGTRALVGYLAGNTLTTAYNHYDGYPSNLGKGLEAHYNDDDKAKDIAMKGYITYLNPDTGEIEQTHKDPAKRINLSQDEEEFAREIAEAIDGMGADYGYIWDDRANVWVTIKNAGIRSMIIQIMDQLGDYGGLDETEEEYLAKKDAAIKKAMGKQELGEIDTSLDPLEDKKEIIRQVVQLIKSNMPADNETIKDFIRTHYNDIINLGDDMAILDEFQEFLSVNTDYVDEKKVVEADRDDEHIVHELIGDLFAPGNARFHLDMSVEEIAKALEDYREGLTAQGVKDAMDLYDKLAADGTLDKEVEEGDGFISSEHVPKLKKAFELIGLYGSGVSEKKGTDHDGDGDVDGDDYMAAKDKAIKKAMGKKSNVNEAVKNIITKILEEQTLNEAATNELARIADEYGSFEGLKPAVIALENIVTEIESFYDKTRAKIQKVYDDLGEVRNDEGLKVGAFIAPSIENAFVKDLKHITKQQFHGGLDMPKVKRISQADVDRGYVQQEAPKQTVYTPVNEKKK